jgi:CubicO group peptidase (beta-lactamase class C family)
MSTLKHIAERWTGVFEQASPLGVAGAIVGIAVGDEQWSMAHGTANLNTGQPFTRDTGFLLGSVTKVLTTTVVMRLVERGDVDLDAPARRYVPEFTLRDANAAERISVRMLLNHSNGIDSDTLFPFSVRGRDASRSYMEYLPQIGVLFEPGACIHYTNPGFVVAARIIEELTGLPFERAIQRELLEPAGMCDTTALQTQAFLRRTGVGAVVDPGTGDLRVSPVFTYGEAAAGAGSTLITTLADMLSFGRAHLRGGVASSGQQILSGELVNAMRSPTYDLGIPQAPPIGLGWWLVPIAGATAAWHGGGSPGGASSFCILPEFEAAIVSFATGPGSGALNDLLHIAAVEELTGQTATPPLEISPTAVDEGLAGEYAAFQKRLVVEAKGDGLVVTDHFEPYDSEHEEVFEAIWRFRPGGPVAYANVAPSQFAKVGTDTASLSGFYGRMGLLATLAAGPVRRAGLHTALRYTPKVSKAGSSDYAQ